MKTNIILAVAALAVSTLLSSCTSPLAQTAAQIGLAYAQKKGLITEGDKIIIGESIAIVGSDDSNQVKEFKLSQLGLQSAVDKGLLHPGDAILVQSPGVDPLIIGAERPASAVPLTAPAPDVPADGPSNPFLTPIKF